MKIGNCAYLLQGIPYEVATEYVKRTYHFDYQGKKAKQLYLFVQYHGEQLPDESYTMVAKKFPGYACNQPESPLGSRFILIAELAAFSKILGYLATIPNSELLKSIHSELENRERAFQIGSATWDSQSSKIMGILNITPDSFFDGGKHFSVANYAEVAGKMIEEGAAILDIGAESTRPGSLPVSEEEELKRLIPAVKAIRSRFDTPISVDTTKPKVAGAMLEMGVEMINDVSGLLHDDEMIRTVAKHNGSYCLMHTIGPSATMQNNPNYDDVIAEIYSFFQEKLKLAESLGLPAKKIVVDPGIGFGKTVTHNLDILRLLAAFDNLPSLLLLGSSNKSFIGHTLGREVDDRLSGTLITQAMGWLSGANIFRVHNVRENHDAIHMARHYTLMEK